MTSFRVTIDLVEKVNRSKRVSKTGICRSVLVPATITLLDLHTVIVRSMGWLDDEHLHEFPEVGDSVRRPAQAIMRKMEQRGLCGWPGDYIPFDDNMNLHETVVQVSCFLKKVGDTILYVYDKYMDWYHLITLEEILTEEIPELTWQPSADKKGFAFQVLEAHKSCPPEDCGGTASLDSTNTGMVGFRKLLAAMSAAEPTKDQKGKLSWLKSFKNGFYKDYDPEVPSVKIGTYQVTHLWYGLNRPPKTFKPTNNPNANCHVS